MNTYCGMRAGVPAVIILLIGATSSQAESDFSFRLCAAAAADATTGSSFLISPLSVRSALEVVAEGADGSTSDVLHALLGPRMMDPPCRLDCTTEQAVSASVSASAAGVPGRSSDQLCMVTGLFAAAGNCLDPQFAQRARQKFGAEVQELDFQSPEASTRINDWVSSRTEGKIPQIVGDVSRTSLLVASALYFYGTWESPFEPRRTNEAPFRFLDGTTQTISMMHQTGRFRYFENDQFQMVRLPYAGGRTALYAFLPRETGTGLNLAQLARTEILETGFKSMKPAEIQVAFPKFHLEGQVRLRGALAALGAAELFDQARANLGGLRRPGSACPELYVTQFLHRTFVSVDENGTEAAASTAAQFEPRSLTLHREKPRLFRADRPFLFAIRSEPTGELLLMGIVKSPGLS